MISCARVSLTGFVAGFSAASRHYQFPAPAQTTPCALKSILCARQGNSSLDKRIVQSLPTRTKRDLFHFLQDKRSNGRPLRTTVGFPRLVLSLPGRKASCPTGGTLPAPSTTIKMTASCMTLRPRHYHPTDHHRDPLDTRPPTQYSSRPRPRDTMLTSLVTVTDHPASILDIRDL